MRLLHRGIRRVCQVSITNCSTRNPDDMDSESSGCFEEESKREKCRNGEKEEGNKSYYGEVDSHVLGITYISNSQNKNRDTCDHPCASKRLAWRDSARS